MSFARTEIVEEMINKKYTLSQSNQSLYSQVGKENYHFPFWIVYEWKPNCVSYAIETAKLLQTFQTPSNILDIGCGRGQFLQAHHGGNHQVYGISIDDDCIPSYIFHKDEKGVLTALPFVKHANHYFGNAEQIDSLDSVNQRKYHLIVSTYTFIHFVDPLGTLKKAYALLENDGILLVDILYLNGLADPMPLLWYLHEQGYEFITSLGESVPMRPGIAKVRSTLSCFFIRKTKPVLDLPLAYIELEDMDERKTIGYTWNDTINQSPINYEDQDFILKISDNEWLQAYAIQKILHLDPQMITNNPQFSPDIGKIALEEKTSKVAIPQLCSPNEKIENIYVSQHIRAGSSLSDLVALRQHWCKTFDSFNKPDCYGFKPIHLIVRIDNLELFKFFILIYPQLLEERTLCQNSMTPLELATYYHNNGKESLIYGYLQEMYPNLVPKFKISKKSDNNSFLFFQDTEDKSAEQKIEQPSMKKESSVNYEYHTSII